MELCKWKSHPLTIFQGFDDNIDKTIRPKERVLTPPEVALQFQRLRKDEFQTSAILSNRLSIYVVKFTLPFAVTKHFSKLDVTFEKINGKYQLYLPFSIAWNFIASF